MKSVHRLLFRFFNLAKESANKNYSQEQALIEVKKRMDARIFEIKSKFGAELAATPPVDQQELRAALERADKNYLTSIY